MSIVNIVLRKRGDNLRIDLMSSYADFRAAYRSIAVNPTPPAVYGQYLQKRRRKKKKRGGKS